MLQPRRHQRLTHEASLGATPAVEELLERYRAVEPPIDRLQDTPEPAACVLALNTVATRFRRRPIRSCRKRLADRRQLATRIGFGRLPARQLGHRRTPGRAELARFVFLPHLFQNIRTRQAS